jgi:serine/threonine protein kinase
MSAPTPPADDLDCPGSETAELARVLEGCLSDLEAGRPVDPERVAAEHPAVAGRLRACLASLLLVQARSAAGPAAPPATAGPPASRLGDFRLVREVGRGGMGVVYEAEQISLGRRVALKVLPFAATLDPRHLQRFKNEAHAAAQLHHGHIVPVHAVGSERGVYYYAMQFIEGQSLAELIAGLRAARPAPEGKEHAQPPAAPSPAAAPPPDLAARSTERSARSPAYFRAVARLGKQAAEALEYAHQLGVVHRDVKPANLLVDAAGHLWVTDFGLARFRTDPGLTVSGDLVGTLRYMSPEQAQARRGLVDHRADIYSLGVTLYEALTLEPAFPGAGREEVLRQVLLGEPRPPRRVSPAVPAALERVVLKAMAREPERRYATAQELAEDLGRFLEHLPVRAVPPTLRERAAKWAWRHKPAVAAAAAVTILAAVGSVATAVLVWDAQRETKAALDRAKAQEALARRGQGEADAQRRRAEENFRKALEGMNGLLWELENPRWNDPAKRDGLRQELRRRGLEFFQEFTREPGADPAARFEAGRAYERMLTVHFLQHQWDPAEEDERHAVALLGGLAQEFPEDVSYRLQLARVHSTVGLWSHSRKRDGAARAAFGRAAEQYRLALPYDSDGQAHVRLAWLLCGGPLPELYDPARAVDLAKQALALGPRKAAYWDTLGLAYYRAGEWPAAADAAEKAMSLKGGGGAVEWLLLAMAKAKLGGRPQAREWYDKSERWLEKNPMTDELFYLRKEAAGALGLPEPGPPGGSG